MKMAWKYNSDKDTKNPICSCNTCESMHGFLKEGHVYSNRRCKQKVITYPYSSLLAGVKRTLKLDIWQILILLTNFCISQLGN